MRFYAASILKLSWICLRPPMCFTVEDADFLVDVMDQALSEL